MKTVFCFLGVDMRCGHDGLITVAKNKKVDLKNLNVGEAAVFINSSRTKIKAYSYNHVVSYYRSLEYSRPIDLAALEMLPKAFDEDGVMDYSAALKAALEKKLVGRKLEEDFIKGK